MAIQFKKPIVPISIDKNIGIFPPPGSMQSILNDYVGQFIDFTADGLASDESIWWEGKRFNRLVKFMKRYGVEIKNNNKSVICTII